jgi:hypothetical protein
MDGLYPIIRRKRRPLAQLDELPVPATLPSTPPQAPATVPPPLPVPEVPQETVTASEKKIPADHELAKNKRTRREQRDAGA